MAITTQLLTSRDVSRIKSSTRKVQGASQKQKIQFVDQTLETVRSYDIEVDEDDQINGDRRRSEPPVAPTPTDTQHRTPAHPIDPSLTAATWPTDGLEVLPDMEQSINNDDIMADLHTWCYHNVSSGESPSVAGNSLSPLSFRDNKPYPEYGTALKSIADAELATNFLYHVGPALDPWDDCRRLAADILEEASGRPELLEVLLMTSATHMSALGTHSGLRYERGFQKRLDSPLIATRSRRGGDTSVALTALLQRTIHNMSGNNLRVDPILNNTSHG